MKTLSKGTFSKKNDDKIERNNEAKKEIRKRTTPTQMQTYQREVKDREILAAIIKNKVLQLLNSKNK